MTSDDQHNTRPERTSATTRRRTRVVDAFIDAVLEGGPLPTPEQIADEAGVSRATFFRYFSTLTDLRGEAATRVIERFPELFTTVDVGSVCCEERIERFVHARFQLHETLHPLELLMRASAILDPESAEFLEAGRRLLADQARQHFEVDLQPHGPATQDDIVSTIGVLTSVESWHQFRRTDRRSPIQTRRAWQTAIARILAL